MPYHEITLCYVPPAKSGIPATTADN